MERRRLIGGEVGVLPVLDEAVGALVVQVVFVVVRLCEELLRVSGFVPLHAGGLDAFRHEVGLEVRRKREFTL